MKKLLLLAVLLFTTVTFAQVETPNVDQPVKKKEYVKYISLGLSMHMDGDFQQQSYPSVEIGVTHNNISYGAVFGRGNLVNIFDKDNIDNYFWEAKFAPSYSIGDLTGTLFAGAGGYIDSQHYFTEVGIGLSYAYKNTSFGVNVSNWDTVNYFTPNITYSFN